MLVYLQLIPDEKERDKFEVIYLRYRGMMFRIADRILKNGADAEDAVHQSFLKLMFRRWFTLVVRVVFFSASALA